MQDTNARLTILRRTAVVAVIAALVALGLDRDATAEAEQKDKKEVVFRTPDPSDPSTAPRLRQQLRTRPLIRQFVVDWKQNPKGIWSNTYLGVPTIQNPLDVWTTQEILYDVKPDFVIETGTYHGGSAMLWATFLQEANPDGRVITIDIEDHVTEAKERPIWKRKVDFIVSSSIEPDLIAKLAERVKDKKVLVILDSDHREEHVFAELEAYAPLVSVGSYMIVQDTGGYAQPKNRKYPGGGRAIRRFVKANDDYKVDDAREQWIMTNNAHGFLKRLR